MERVDPVIGRVLHRAEAINTLKEGAALSAVDAAIETIRDHRERWASTYEPEEDAFTREILGTLIELQVRSVEMAVKLGDAMARRKLADPDNDDDPTPPAQAVRVAA